MASAKYMDEFRTDDIEEAAFVESHGLRSTIERRADGRCVFVFSARDDAAALARRFTTSESAAFARARRALCWQLHRV